jgi:Histidine phosphatase superfamily (branch 1)
MKLRSRSGTAREILALSGAAAALITLHAQAPASDALVNQLRQGGYVLVMRHASSPRQVPTKDTANPDNTKLERQLDEAGRRGATAMGDALRGLRIPIGTVLTSPTYRAIETVKLHSSIRPPPWRSWPMAAKACRASPRSNPHGCARE